MSENLGAQLKSIRESRGISLEEISNKTHIRLAYLEALESGEISQLIAGPQVRGFLKLYASELGLKIEGEKVMGLEQNSEPPGETKASASIVEAKTFTNSKAEIPEEEKKETEEARSPQPEGEGLEEQLIDSPQKTDLSKPASASFIFSELGDAINQRRQLLSLSIDDVQEHTHIRKKFLTMMEEGTFSQLPSPVNARGMLANYADFLNLDVDEILLKYADGLQRQRLEKANLPEHKSPGRTTTMSTTRLRLKNFFSLDLLVIAALFIGFAVFAIWGINRILNANEPSSASKDLPEVADVLLATGSPTPQASPNLDSQAPDQDLTETPDSAEPTPLFTPLPNDNPINIVIIPRQRVWVRVITDSETAFEGRMFPGNAYDFSGQENLEVLTGSAGAIQIFFNEQDLGAPGLLGQVANLIFLEDGLVLPTPTKTPTFTETPDVTLTPTPTPSQTPDAGATPPNSND
jgi:cytoskeleton protein RodZ